MRFRSIKNDKLAEWAFLVYIILMSFAKAIGLNSNNKVFYYITAVAFGAVMASIISGKYLCKEYLLFVLFGILVLLLFNNTHVLSPVLLLFTWFGAKNTDTKKLSIVLLFTWLCGYIFNFFLTIMKIVPMPMRFDKDHNTVRYGMGFLPDNLFAIVLVIITSIWGYAIKKKKKWMYLVILGFTIVVFRLSDSRLGVIMQAFTIITWIIVDYCDGSDKWNHLLDRVYKCVFLLPMFASLLIIRYADMSNEFWLRLSRLSTNRVFIIAHAYEIYTVKMFGQEIVGYGWSVIDNAYAHMLLQFGYVYFVLFMLLYIWLFMRLDEAYVREKALAFLFLVTGMVEQYMQNCIMNVSLLIIFVISWKKIRERWESDSNNINAVNVKTPASG